MTTTTAAGRSPGPWTAAPPTVARSGRRTSLDVVRGLAIVGMLLVNNSGVPSATPVQLAHSDGAGLTLADLVFPLFLFVAGVGMSLSPRLGAPRDVLRRCGLLFVLGCLLVSARYRHLSPSTGVLQHVALATLAAYALLRLPRRVQPWAWLGAFAAAWAAPTFLALPGTVAGSWEPGTTLASAVERAVTGHVGKEQVVAAVVSGLTVVLGVFAGRVLQAQPGLPGVLRLLQGAGLLAGTGLLLSRAVPIDESLWTPSFVLVSGAVCVVLLAAAVALLDLGGWAPAAQPLRVLGANAIAVYVVTTLLYSGVLAPYRDELVQPLRVLAGDTTAAVAYAASSVLLGWCLCAWLWRRRIFLKV
jgi:predicted acyltransferase